MAIPPNLLYNLTFELLVYFFIPLMDLTVPAVGYPAGYLLLTKKARRNPVTREAASPLPPRGWSKSKVVLSISLKNEL